MWISSLLAASTTQHAVPGSLFWMYLLWGLIPCALLYGTLHLSRMR